MMDWSFTTPIWLCALPVAALPLLLHLRTGTRPRWLDFPGAFFLSTLATPAADPRRRLTDVALLLLRCGLLALAVAALAGPRVRAAHGWWAGEETGAGEAVVVVVDDSPSLRLRRGPAGDGLLTQTLDEVAAALADGPPRRVAYETASGGGGELDTPEALRAQLPALAGATTFQGGDRPAALRRAVARLRDAAEERRVVLLVTDLGLSDQEGEDAILEENWSAALAPFSEPGSPALLVLGLSSLPARQWTVDVQPLLPEPPPALVSGTPIQVAAHVLCLSGPGARRLIVECAPVRDDAQGRPTLGQRIRLAERNLELRAGEKAEVTAVAPAPEPGLLWVGARLEEADDLPFDDAAETLLLIQPKRTVILADARPAPRDSGAPFQDAALRGLAAALDPVPGVEASRVQLRGPIWLNNSDLRAALRGGGGAAPFSTERLPAGTVLVALHGPEGPVLERGELEQLRALVEDGLSIVWVPDLTGRPAQWSASGARSLELAPLLPCPIEGAEAAPPEKVTAHTPSPALPARGEGDLPPRTGGVRGGAWTPERLPEKSPPAGEGAWRLAFATPEHPVLRPFAGGRNGDLAAVRLQRRLLLERHIVFGPRAGSDGSEDAVLARFSDGRPALVLRRVGEGGVGQLAFGLEPQGGVADSAAWPVLLSAFIEWAAGDGLGPEQGPVHEPDAPPAQPWPVGPRDRARQLLLDGPHFARPLDVTVHTPSPALPAGGEGVLPPRAGGVRGGVWTGERLPLDLASEGRHEACPYWAWELPPGATQLAWPALPYPGFYRLRVQDRASERWGQVRIAGTESGFARLPGAVQRELGRACRRAGGRVVPTVAGLPQALAALRPGRSLAPFIWLVFAAVMGAELGLLAWRRHAA